MFFDWLYVALPLSLLSSFLLPKSFTGSLSYARYSPLLVRVLSSLGDVPNISTPALKFLAEFAHDKSSRLQFEIASANGILLFRVISEVIVTYGEAPLYCLFSFFPLIPFTSLAFPQ